VESFVALVVAGLGVGVAIDGLHLPLGILEHHLFILLLLRIHLLFALLMAGRCTFLAWLLLLFVEVFHELLDLSVLTHAVAHRVMNQALGATVVTAGCLMRALVTSWASAPTHRHNCSYGGTNQRLVFAFGLLLLIFIIVVATTLRGSHHVRLAILSCPGGRLGVPGMALAHLPAKLKSLATS
jgi:hypothetical protein